MADIQFTDKKNDYLLKFDISCDVSLVNAVRRTIESDVETIGFNTEPYEDSDVDIIENTSSIHNEMLMHRIGLVPPNVVDVDGFDPTRYKFILEKQNTGSKIINITSKDIKIIDNNTNTEVDNSVFFKSDPITNDHILIIKLKPNPDGNGEKVNIVAKGSRGNGAQNARFSPTSCNAYQNKIDNNKYKEALENYIQSEQEKNTSLDIKQATNHFSISEGERYFITDKYDRPNMFEYTLESIGILPSHIILNKALSILFIKIKQFMVNFNGALDNTNDKVSIEDTTGIMKGYTITIQDETHTLGYLLQSYIEILHGEKIHFVGYRNPHPLKKFIELDISTESNNMDEIKSIILETCSSIIQIIEQIRKKLLSEFGMKKPATKKIIKKKK